MSGRLPGRLRRADLVQQAATRVRADVSRRPGQGASAQDVATSTRRILRTVYLPSADADALKLKVESLEVQLAEQRQAASERIDALMQDRALREQVRPTELAGCCC